MDYIWIMLFLIVKIITDILFFIYYHKSLTDILMEIGERLDELTDRVNRLENLIYDRKGDDI